MRVLIADDDPQVVRIVSAMVKACHHEVVGTVTTGGLDALRAVSKLHPDLVLLDVMMPKYNGFSVCSQLMSTSPNLKVVLVSGQVDQNYPNVSTCGAFDYLRKPIGVQELKDMLHKVEAAIAAKKQA